MTHVNVAALLTCAIAGVASLGAVVAWRASPVAYAAASTPGPAATVCSVNSNPSMVATGSGAGQAASIADVIEIGCDPVFSGSSVTIDATQLSNHCQGTLQWSRAFPFAPASGPQFTVTLDGDGNAVAVVWGGPLCAGGSAQISATLNAPPFSTVSTSFTILPPRNADPGVAAHPASEVEDAMWGSVATVIEVAFPSVQAGKAVTIQSHDLLTRCANGLTWVGPEGTFIASGVDHVDVTLDNNGNAFVVALAGPSCAAGSSTIAAHLTAVPYTTYLTQFTTLSPRPTYGPSSISTTPSSPGGVPVGAALTDSAHVTGSNPTGTVTFYLFGPDNPQCNSSPTTSTSPPWVAMWRITLTGGHAAVPPPGYAATQPGTYRWVASYGGDSSNQPADSGCNAEDVTVTKATPSLSTSASGGGTVGVRISDSATVTGGYKPQGAVAFSLYPPGDPTCTGTAAIVLTEPLSVGSATTSATPFTTNAAGTYHWIAVYSGDAANKGAATACGDEPVATGVVATSLSTQPSRGGQTGTGIADSATVAGGSSPTGTVTFNLYGPNDPSCAGAPLFMSTTPLGHSVAVSNSFSGTSVAGTYQWTAIYNGDAYNPSSRSVCGERVAITSAVIGAVQGTNIQTPVTSAHIPVAAALTLVNLGTLLCLAGTEGSGGRRVRARTRGQGGRT